MQRQAQELIEAIRELDAAFDRWAYSTLNNENEFDNLVKMAQAVGKVNGKAFILEQESKPFSSFQHNEHLYGTENSQG